MNAPAGEADVRAGESPLKPQPWLVIWVGWLLTNPHPGHAAAFSCAVDDVACLIAAINAANANGGENTITLAAGIYTLTAVDNDTDGPSGLPSVTGVLTIRGVEAETTIIERASDAPGFRIMHVAAVATLTLEDVTLRRGVAGDVTGPGPIGGRGVGLFNAGGTVTLTNSIVARVEAITHRVAPLIAYHLASFPAQEVRVPALIRERLQACLVKNAAVKCYRAQQLAKALTFLQGRGLAVMLLEGAVLDVLVYTQPWYTMSNDVDLLLRCRWEALGAEDRAALETFKRQDRADLPSLEVGYGTHPDVTMYGTLPIDFAHCTRSPYRCVTLTPALSPRERGSRPRPLVLQSSSLGYWPRQEAGPGDERGKGGDCEDARERVCG